MSGRSKAGQVLVQHPTHTPGQALPFPVRRAARGMNRAKTCSALLAAAPGEGQQAGAQLNMHIGSPKPPLYNGAFRFTLTCVLRLISGPACTSKSSYFSSIFLKESSAISVEPHGTLRYLAQIKAEHVSFRAQFTVFAAACSRGRKMRQKLIVGRRRLAAAQRAARPAQPGSARRRLGCTVQAGRLAAAHSLRDRVPCYVRVAQLLRQIPEILTF